MLGAIIGDIVGSRFEFNNTKSLDFDLFTSDCSFTDDTICTVAIADAILNGKSYRDSLLEWCRKYPNPMGAYGGGFARWIFSDNPQPYNSYGNGSAMRVSPVGWLFDRNDHVVEEASLTASVTHNHEEGIKGAQVVAMCIFLLRYGYDKNRILDFIRPFYGEVKMPAPFTNPFNETCQETVPVAIACFLESNSFEEAVRNSIVIGGDSDTIGAITGSIAEAFYRVPDDMREKAFSYLPEDMLRIIQQFYYAQI